MGKKLYLTGERFGRLVVLKEGGRTNQNAIKWVCLCDCGKTIEVSIGHLRFGDTKSCGCIAIAGLIKRTTTHNKRYTPEYLAWSHMKTRCYNKKYDLYHCYGGRGIKICGRWLSSFDAFFDDMGERPSPKHSLDRFPNQNGDYEPENCRWATPKQQSGNKTNNKWIELDGKKMIQSDWAREFNMDVKKLHYYLKSTSIQRISEMVSSGGIIDKRFSKLIK